jgi:hypothetical protein
LKPLEPEGLQFGVAGSPQTMGQKRQTDLGEAVQPGTQTCRGQPTSNVP